MDQIFVWPQSHLTPSACLTHRHLIHRIQPKTWIADTGQVTQPIESHAFNLRQSVFLWIPLCTYLRAWAWPCILFYRGLLEFPDKGHNPIKACQKLVIAHTCLFIKLHLKTPQRRIKFHHLPGNKIHYLFSYTNVCNTGALVSLSIWEIVIS